MKERLETKQKENKGKITEKRGRGNFLKAMKKKKRKGKLKIRKRRQEMKERKEIKKGKGRTAPSVMWAFTLCELSGRGHRNSIE